MSGQGLFNLTAFKKCTNPVLSPACLQQPWGSQAVHTLAIEASAGTYIQSRDADVLHVLQEDLVVRHTGDVAKVTWAQIMKTSRHIGQLLEVHFHVENGDVPDWIAWHAHYYDPVLCDCRNVLDGNIRNGALLQPRK